MSGTGVVIVANGGANIASLQCALGRLNVEATLSADANLIRAADRIILPGVGAAADAMARLRTLQLDALLPTLTQPVLGICLGMQLLFDDSAEGDVACLGIIPGRVTRFAAQSGLPVPHMGWNTLDLERPSPLLEGVRSGDYAYFVHSYAVPRSHVTLASAEYGTAFSACVAWRNFYGTQFHPERSSRVGARVLDNFLRL